MSLQSISLLTELLAQVPADGDLQFGTYFAGLPRLRTALPAATVVGTKAGSIPASSEVSFGEGARFLDFSVSPEAIIATPLTLVFAILVRASGPVIFKSTPNTGEYWSSGPVASAGPAAGILGSELLLIQTDGWPIAGESEPGLWNPNPADPVSYQIVLVGSQSEA